MAVQMATYTKLWSQILDSTVWTQTDNDFRVLWIAILAKKDKDHMVFASIPGLAAIANITPEKCEQYLKRLMSPDRWSGNQEFEGRRLLPIEGGWFVVSGRKYQDFMREEQKKAAQAKAQKAYRERQKFKKGKRALSPEDKVLGGPPRLPHDHTPNGATRETLEGI